MIADIMGLLNIDQVNKFTKDERKWTVFKKLYELPRPFRKRTEQ